MNKITYTGFKLNDVYSSKLNWIARRFRISNGRALQSCISYVFSLDSHDGEFRHHNEMAKAKIVYIPFQPETYTRVKKSITANGYGSVSELFRVAIDKTIEDLSAECFQPNDKTKKCFFG